MRRAARVPARSSMSATDPSSRSAGRTLSAMTDPRARAGRSSRPPDAPENAGTCSSCTRITRRRDTWGSRTTTSVSSRRADAELPRSQNCCAIRAPGSPGPTTSRSCSADRRPKRSTTSQGRAMLTRSSSAPRPFEDYDEGSADRSHTSSARSPTGPSSSCPSRPHQPNQHRAAWAGQRIHERRWHDPGADYRTPRWSLPARPLVETQYHPESAAVDQRLGDVHWPDAAIVVAVTERGEM